MTLSTADVVLKSGQQFRFNFANGSSEISEGAETRLNSIAESLERDEELRLQLLAYAGGRTNPQPGAANIAFSRASYSVAFIG